MRYIRTTGGEMVHKVGCPFSRAMSAVEWRWANDKTPEEIVAVSAAHGIKHRWCKHCFKGYFPDLNQRLAS